MRQRIATCVAWVLVSIAGIAVPARATEVSPYVQTQVIASKADQGTILGFCVPSGGGLVAVTGAREQYGAGVQGTDAKKLPPHRLVWFAADGTEIRSVKLDFAANVAGAAPDGGVYVAGDGVVAHLSADGREVARGSTPQGPRTDEETEQFEKFVAERHEAQIAACDKQIERLRGAVAELEKNAEEAEASDEEEPDDEEQKKLVERRRKARMQTARPQADRMAAQLRQIEAQVDHLRQQDMQQVVEQTLRRLRQVRAVSAIRDAVFVVTSEATGFGYTVWRLDGRLEHPEKILSGLTGCCSQMDVQICGERLAIAANRKHCVELVTFTGDIVGKVGQRARDDEDTAGFGGCCNPMNICAAPDSSLLTSESNGVVKRFDAAGQFVEIVGTAKVRGGCKNSAIAIEPDDSRLYYMDAAHGNVIVLTKTERQEPDAVEQEP